MFTRVYLSIEVFILTQLVGQERPGPIFRWIFKLPALIYQLGLGRLIGRQILLLATIGRKTGKWRYTPLEYTYDAQRDAYLVMAGWGGRTDWCRNVRSNPKVQVRVGSQSFDALAEPLADTEIAEIMLQVTRKNAHMLKVWSRWSSGPVETTRDSMLAAACHFPSFRLRKIG